MGYGVIAIEKKKMSLITMGVINLSKLNGQALKLKNIFEKTLELVEKYNPDELSIEAPFFGKNVQSMLKLGRAQGVAMSAALYRDVPIFEYTPKKIKKSITGNGNASKQQVAAMLKSLFNLDKTPTQLDATDGLAAATCHFFQNSSGEPNKQYNDWGSFIKNNPDKIA